MMFHFPSLIPYIYFTYISKHIHMYVCIYTLSIGLAPFIYYIMGHTIFSQCILHTITCFFLAYNINFLFPDVFPGTIYILDGI